MFLKLLFSAIFFPIIVGYLTVSIISKDDDLYPLEILALSYGIGVGIISFIMFIMGVFLVPLKVSYILLTCSAVFAFPIIICIKNKRFLGLGIKGFKDKVASIKWHELLMLSMISIRILISYFQALIKPVQEIDSITYRMMEAKIFFIEHGLSLNQAQGYFIGPAAQKHYPLNISLFSSWIYSALGTWNDLLVKIIFPTFLLAMAIIFYYSMRRIANRPASLFSTYLLLTLPFLMYHSSISYIDAVVGFYFFSSFVFLLLFIRTGKISHLILSALLAGICTWTKNEGLPLILSDLIVLFYYLAYMNKDESARKIRIFIQYCAGILLFIAPWSVFRYIFRDKIIVPEEIPNFRHLFECFYRIPVIFEFFYRKALLYGNWNIAWFLLIIVIVISLIRKRFHLENIFVLFAIVFGLVSFGSVYCLSKNSWPYLLDGTVQNRNFLTFMPLVVYFTCISVFRKNDNILESSK